MESLGKIASLRANFRKQQRNQHVSQMLQAFRFQHLLHLQQQQLPEREPLTITTMEQIVTDTDLQALYQLSFEADYSQEDIMLERSEAIIEMLAARLNLPLSLLILGNLINNYEVFAAAVFESKLFEQLVWRVQKEEVGSPPHNALMWTIASATDRPNLVDSDQLQPLIPYLQNLVEGLIQQQDRSSFQGMDHLLIRLIKNISEADVMLRGQLVVWLADYFWKGEEEVSKVNIYLVCCNLINSSIAPASTKVLLQALAVCLKGRSQLPRGLEQVLSSQHSILMAALRKNNQFWEGLSPECEFRVNGKPLRLTIHSFLLDFETHLFLKMILTPQDVDFLTEFFRKAPLEETISRWLQIGTIDSIVSALTSDQLTRKQALSLLELMGWRVEWQSEDRFYWLQRLKSEGRVGQAVQEAMQLFPELRGNALRKLLNGEHGL